MTAVFLAAAVLLAAPVGALLSPLVRRAVTTTHRHTRGKR